MEDIIIEPPQDDEEPESLFGTVLLRFCVMFLSALMGFALAILGHMYALLFIEESEEFNEHTILYFFISIVLWILIGLCTPFRFIKEFFEGLRGVTNTAGGVQFGRLSVYGLVFVVFIVLYRYFLTYAVAAVVALLDFA